MPVKTHFSTPAYSTFTSPIITIYTPIFRVLLKLVPLFLHPYFKEINVVRWGRGLRVPDPVWSP